MALPRMMVVFRALAVVNFLSSSSVLALPKTIGNSYTLDPGWPADLLKIGPMNGTSGVDVNPVTGEVYMCQQRGSPRVTVWDGQTGKLLRSWGDSDLDTPHAVRTIDRWTKTKRSLSS